MLGRDRILVVTDDAERADFWAASLELEGYDADICSGPGASRDCPRLHEVRCSLRERARVALVDLDCDEDAPVCTKIPDDGGTVFVRRSFSIGRGELSIAIDDARRHVEHLQGAPLLNQPVRAPDLD